MDSSPLNALRNAVKWKYSKISFVTLDFKIHTRRQNDAKVLYTGSRLFLPLSTDVKVKLKQFCHFSCSHFCPKKPFPVCLWLSKRRLRDKNASIVQNSHLTLIYWLILRAFPYRGFASNTYYKRLWKSLGIFVKCTRLATDTICALF